MNLLETAQNLYDHGLCIIPVRNDGSKSPSGKWKQYQQQRPPYDQLADWFATGKYDGLGVVTGAVSGNLEMIEFEGRAVADGALEQLIKYASENDLSDLIMRLTGGYLEETPSGGIHILYQVSDGVAQPNAVFAKNKEDEVLAESRGEGGFCVIAPSHGRAHPTGKPWVLDGGCTGIPIEITSDERDRLWALLTWFDEKPVATENAPVFDAPSACDSGSLRPGDDFNNRANWDDILTPHGWKLAFKMHRGLAWTRPGKDKGLSATTGYSTDGADRLLVFSTSTPFEAYVPATKTTAGRGKVYNKFAAYTLLEHGGDYKAAAKYLASQGYGSKRTPSNTLDVADVADVADISEGGGTSENGGDLLDEIQSVLNDYVAFPTPAASAAVAAWIVHTHALDCFDTTPRLALLSPEPGSGKTRALEVIELLTPNPMPTFNTSPAVLFRSMTLEDEDGKSLRPTILLDEADTIFGTRSSNQHEDLRGFINAGYRRGANAQRAAIHGKTVVIETFPAFAAVAIAGLDDLPDTVMTRSIVIRMRRRLPSEHVLPYRRRNNEALGKDLSKRIKAWCESHRSSISQELDVFPDGIEDRAADIWEPLLIIGDLAGGEWSERIRAAAVEFVGQSRNSGETLGIRLLADIRTIFDGRDRISTVELLEGLNNLEDSPWGDMRGKPLDARQLSRRLRKYNINSHNIRTNDSICKGYESTDMNDSWMRYLPAPLQESATSATSATSDDPDPLWEESA